MDLRTLIESLHRLYLDPRVGPTTEVHVEMEKDYNYSHICGCGTSCTDAPLSAIAINGSGRRAIVLSALPRRDAFAR